MSRYTLSKSRSDLSVPYTVDPERCTVPLFGSSVKSERRSSVSGGEEKTDALSMAITRSYSAANFTQMAMRARQIEQQRPSYSVNYIQKYYLGAPNAYRADNEINLLYSTWANTTRFYYGPYPQDYKRYAPGSYGIYDYGSFYPWYATNYRYYPYSVYYLDRYVY